MLCVLLQALVGVAHGHPEHSLDSENPVATALNESKVIAATGGKHLHMHEAGEPCAECQQCCHCNCAAAIVTAPLCFAYSSPHAPSPRYYFKYSASFLKSLYRPPIA